MCIELVIIDGRAIGYIFTGWYLNADEAAATRGIAERMLIVGGGQEGGISATVILALSEDGAAIHLDLGE